MKTVKFILISLLMLIALYVAVNLALGNGPRWFAITSYWFVLTIKNTIDWRFEK